MDGFSWAIIACIGAFVYRLYSKNPQQFVENWNRFFDNLNSLFDPGGREAPENNEIGPDLGNIRGHRRSRSKGTEGADGALKTLQPGATREDDGNLKNSAFTGEGDAQGPNSPHTASRVRTLFS